MTQLQMYTDRTMWTQALHTFTTNRRPVVQVYTPAHRGIRPVVAIAPQPGFVDLIRLHNQEPVGYEGGDVVVDSRVLTDIATDHTAMVEHLALRYRWTSPAPYTMSLVFDIPKHLDFLCTVARFDGFFCTAAPFRQGSSLLWLGLNPDTAAAITMIDATYQITRGRR